MPPRKDSESKPPLELPSPRHTHASNRGKVVSTPDMAKPRCSHQEVLEERAAQEKAKDNAALKEKRVCERIAQLEASL